MAYHIGDSVWLAYRYAHPKAGPRKGVIREIYGIPSDKRLRYKIKDIVSKRTLGIGIVGENLFLSEDEAWDAYYKEMKRRGREPYKREEKKVEKKKSPEGLVTGNMCLMAWFNKMDIHIHELPYDEALELYYAAAEEWPDGLPLKPDEWEGLGERKQVEYLQYVRGLVEMRVGKKALSRYRHKKEEGMTDQQFDDWWESNQQRRLIEELDDRYRNRQNCNNNRNNSDNVGALSEAVALNREAVALNRNTVALNREAVTLSRKRVAFSRKLFALQCTLFGIELALFAFLLILTLFFN